MHIICQWQLFGPDIYPEFAPEPIMYADCNEVATTRVTGSDSYPVDVFVCDNHVADAMLGLIGGEAEPIPELYARGYATAAAEADHVALTFDQAQYLLHEDEYPVEIAPHPPLSVEWATGEGHATLGELVLSDDDAAQYELGFLRGWRDRLGDRAADLVRQHDFA